MNIDTAISKNGCKPRGRPRKHPSDDHRMNARRERNRAAQKSFRLRHRTNEEVQRQEEVKLENKFNHLLSVFLSFTDQVVHSEWASRDMSLMEALRCSVKDVLDLTDDGPNMAVKNSWQSRPDSTGPGNYGAKPNGAVVSHQESNIQLQPSLSGSQPSELQDSTLEVGKFRQHVRKNISVSASINFQAPSLGQCRLDSPFSLQIAHLAVQYACRILSTATSPENDALSRVFGSRLKVHTRQEILFSLQWHLGPGYSQLDCLATAIFAQPIFSNTNMEREDRQLYNSDQIAKILRQRTCGLAGDDCLDVMVNNGISATNNLVHASTMQAQNMNYSSSETMVVVRVSKLELLHNISSRGICFGSGPAFLGADVKKAIWDSILPGSYIV